MHYTAFIGIDVSKLTFDAFIHAKNLKQPFANNAKGFALLLRWLQANLNAEELKGALICFEHTGIYSLNLSLFLQSKNLVFVIVPALDIKRSLGTTRGKSDELDARRIAAYACLKKDQLRPSQLPGESIQRLQPLLSLRDQLVTQRASHRATCKERTSVFAKKDHKNLFLVYAQIIRDLSAQIKKLEAAIAEIIREDQAVKDTFDLVTGIKGIGPLTAGYLIVYTHNFTRFESWRKFACYCGIAPFPHSSGTSLKGKTRVSHLANKHIKSLLFLCANNAVKTDTELRAYYQKRTQEGKSKMSTLNIIKNKLIARAFAVVKRQTPFVLTAA
jgi:transposase